jgi:MYXO-CTERM domain-containing protein
MRRSVFIRPWFFSAAALLATSAAAASPPPLSPFGGSYVESICQGFACQIDNDYWFDNGSNFGQHALDAAAGNAVTDGYGAPSPTMSAAATSHSPLIEVHAAADLTYWFRYTAADLAGAAALDAYKQQLIDDGALCSGRACRANTVPVVHISGFWSLDASAGGTGQVVGGSSFESFSRTCSGTGAWAANCGAGTWSILAPLTKVSDLSYDGFVHLSADALVPEDSFACAGLSCLASANAWIDPVISLRPGFAGADGFSLTLNSGLANGTSPPSSPTPEPAAWAMTLLGLGALGARLRSRRRLAAWA